MRRGSHQRAWAGGVALAMLPTLECGGRADEFHEPAATPPSQADPLSPARRRSQGGVAAGSWNSPALPPHSKVIPAHKLLPHVEHPHWRQTRDLPDDPLFPSQWHLRNTGQGGGAPGADVNVTPWWHFAGSARLGAGVVIGIVDGGVETTHPDLAANYLPALSYDFLSGDPDPNPTGGGGHGTAVAGVAAARGGNGLGVTGVAPRAGLAALRLTSPTFQTDAMEAAALTFQNDNQGGLGTIHIYNNSWGPQDDGRTLAGPGPLTRAALASGTATGRGALGSVLVWAVGNGRGALDAANYDGYANSRFVVGVGACTNQGLATSFSEAGACVFVCAPSDGGPGSQARIVTTDRVGALGYNLDPVTGDYATNFAGTSAAAPQIAGIVALLFEVNPALTWRDVKHLLAATASWNDPAGASWGVNAAGFRHSDHYGFGLADADAAATLAATWTPVAPEAACTSGPLAVGQPIADGAGMSLTVPVYGPAVTSTFTCTAALRVETVSVTVNITHAYRGDLEIAVTSPTGVESVLGTIRNDSGDHYTGWTFTSVKDWGEYAAGPWTLRVRDGISNDAGTLVDWTLTLHGTPAATLPEVRALTRLAADRWQLRCPTAPGVMYQVFESTTLAADSWQPLGAKFPATANETLIEVTIAPGAPRDFFRIAPVH